MNIPAALRKVADNSQTIPYVIRSMFYALADELEQQQKNEDERDEKLKNDLQQILDEDT